MDLKNVRSLEFGMMRADDKRIATLMEPRKKVNSHMLKESDQ